MRYNAWGNKISDITDDQLAMFPYLTKNPRNNVTDFFKNGANLQQFHFFEWWNRIFQYLFFLWKYNAERVDGQK